MSYDCFISYQSGDLQFAERVHAGLVTAGIDPARIWFDRLRLKPGFEWHKEIESGCESSRILLAVLTPRWQQSQWTRFETYGAENIIPLRFEGRFEDVAPPPLKRFQAQEISFADTGATGSWEQLAESVRALLARPIPEKTERVSLLRYHHNPHFVGREQEMLTIHQQLHENPTATLTQGQVHVIAALGGMGKTTLAREYAEKFWRCYAQILWVDARNPGGLEAEYADLFATLNPESADLKQGERAQRLLRQLAGREERLLVIDNAEDEGSIQRWLPKSGGCRTIVTSRFTDWSTAIGVTRIEALQPEAARQLLLDRTGVAAPSADELAACNTLAEQLGCLPLALEQAAAYMRKQRMGFSQYLKRYNDESAGLLRKGVLGATEYPDAVMTTWAATISRLPAPSRALLRLAAFMAASSIPLEFFVRGAGILRNAIRVLSEQELTGQPQETLPEDDEELVREALGALADYSMVTMEENSFRVHGLVQTVERVDLPLERHALWSFATTTFVRTCPDDPTDPIVWPLVRQISAHLDVAAWYGWDAVKKMADHPEAEKNVSRRDLFTCCLEILTYLGQFQSAVGGFQAAEKYLRLALDNDALLPPDAHRTIRPLAYLSDLLLETDRLKEAIELRRREVSFYESEARPDTAVWVARPLRRLADALETAGELKEAEAVLLRAIGIAEKQSDAAGLHLTRDCLLSLASLYRDTGRDDDADRCIRRADIVSKHSPEGVPAYTLGMAELEAAYRESRAGNADAADQQLQRFLEINEKSPESAPDIVASAFESAANVYRLSGRFERAEQLLRRALDMKGTVYGLVHVEPAGTWSKLAELYQEMDRYEDALLSRRAAVKILEALFPNGHSSTADALLSLAILLRTHDNDKEAEPLLRQALAMAEGTRGPLHVLTGNCCAQLGYLLLDSNHVEEADVMLNRALEIYSRHYGAVSDGTGEFLRAWIGRLNRTGHLEKATALAGRSLRLHETLHGAQSLELLNDLDIIGLLAYKREDWPRYEESLRLGLSIIEKSAAQDDPLRMEWSGTLGMYLYHANRRAEAEPFLRQASAGTPTSNEAVASQAIHKLALVDFLYGTSRTQEGEPLALHALEMLLRLKKETGEESPALPTATEAWFACRLQNGVAGPQVQGDAQKLFDEYGFGSVLKEIQAGWVNAAS